MSNKSLEKAVNIVILCILAVFIVDGVYGIYTKVRINQSVERSDRVIAEQERQIVEQDELLEQLRKKLNTKE